MNLLRSKTAPIREKRLHAIAAYSGKIDALLYEAEEEELSQRVRTFSQDSFSDILYAVSVLSTIKKSAIIIHGASGCASARLFSNNDDESHSKWAVTNLKERDSIMGSDFKLKEGIKQLHGRYRPEIIFVVSTPVVAINNDDIESVVEELKSELNIEIVPVYTDGFRSKIALTGYDVVSHALLKHLFSPKKEDTDHSINLISFSEKEDDLLELRKYLEFLGLKINVFPNTSSLEEIRRIKKAQYSISINPDESDYPGTILSEYFNIPFIQSVIPIGLENTSRWLTDIINAIGIDINNEEYIKQEKETLIPILASLRDANIKGFLNLPPAYAFGVIGLFEDLGIELVGLKLDYVDERNLADLAKINKRYPDLPLLIGEGQLFEEENIIRKVYPDLYIGNNIDFTVAIRNGIPAIDLRNVPLLGFRGIENLATKIKKTIRNKSFSMSLIQEESETYKQGWLKKNPNWYIKQEVR